MIKVDSPTVQRVGVMLFVQAVVNLGWTDNWMKGDISTAFLQGEDRDVEKLGKLYLELQQYVTLYTPTTSDPCESCTQPPVPAPSTVSPTNFFWP